MIKLTSKGWLFLIGFVSLIVMGGFWVFKNSNLYPVYEVGQEIDSFNGVPVYYNGGFSNVSGRNLSSDGYNYGLKWQCVEFAKKYYHDHLNHKMPNTYGHAKDFFNPNIPDGEKNPDRNLFQYKNASSSKPKVNDLLIFDKTPFNPFGHIAIISKVSKNQIEIIQQNVGDQTRANLSLRSENGKWKILNSQTLGWLRKE